MFCKLLKSLGKKVLEVLLFVLLSLLLVNEEHGEICTSKGKAGN